MDLYNTASVLYPLDNVNSGVDSLGFVLKL